MNTKTFKPCIITSQNQLEDKCNELVKMYYCINLFQYIKCHFIL